MRRTIRRRRATLAEVFATYFLSNQISALSGEADRFVHFLPMGQTTKLEMPQQDIYFADRLLCCDILADFL